MLPDCYATSFLGQRHYLSRHRAQEPLRTLPRHPVCGEPEKELIALAKEKDIGTIVMKPLAGGAIRNVRSAFNFFNNYPVDIILNGVSNLAELQKTLSGLRAIKS